jgi:Tfp pilus assembly protein PilE
MKQNRHRVSAFTILELTIVMLLSAIVIGITYTAYSIMSNAYLDFTRKNEAMGELIRVDELLKKDFEKSGGITINGRTLIFENNANITKYQLEPDFIVRSSLITDTFKIKTTNLIASFENQVIEDDQSDQVAVHPIDGLSLGLLFKTDTIVYNYHKIYSSQNLFKTSANAFN